MAVSLGKLALGFFPALELDFLGAGAARIAGILTGVDVHRTAEGWMLSAVGRPVLVTPACSGADYFLIVTALISWQLARRKIVAGWSIPTWLIVASFVSIGVNSLRIVTVIQAHRWLIPLLPPVYSHFAHLLVGAGVFLPFLIALNFLLELHGHARTASNALAE